MTTALVIGGTGFVGQHVAAELLEHDYDVTILSRKADESLAEHIPGLSAATVDRSDSVALRSVREEVEPDLVVDCALFHPSDAEHAIEVFSDVDTFVYVSSGGVYAAHEIPKREDVTPLHAFDDEHQGNDTMASYGPRKAECDRIIRLAADRGAAASCIRPTMVYGPKSGLGSVGIPDDIAWAPDLPGLQQHHDFWIHRLDRYDRVVVPGDGTAIWHRVYVEDVARAIRLVAENGEPGEAYNVADRRVLTMEDVLELIGETLGIEIEIVHASRRELEPYDLQPDDFVLYHHLNSTYPHVLSTCKIAELGFQSTPVRLAMEKTVEESLASDRDGSFFDPGREAEEQFLEAVA